MKFFFAALVAHVTSEEPTIVENQDVDVPETTLLQGYPRRYDYQRKPMPYNRPRPRRSRHHRMNRYHAARLAARGYGNGRQRRYRAGFVDKRGYKGQKARHNRALLFRRKHGAQDRRKRLYYGDQNGHELNKYQRYYNDRAHKKLRRDRKNRQNLRNMQRARIARNNEKRKERLKSLRHHDDVKQGGHFRSNKKWDTNSRQTQSSSTNENSNNGHHYIDSGNYNTSKKRIDGREKMHFSDKDALSKLRDSRRKRQINSNDYGQLDYKQGRHNLDKRYDQSSNQAKKYGLDAKNNDRYDSRLLGRKQSGLSGKQAYYSNKGGSFDGKDSKYQHGAKYNNEKYNGKQYYGSSKH